jgi:hypothetical protein
MQGAGAPLGLAGTMQVDVLADDLDDIGLTLELLFQVRGESIRRGRAREVEPLAPAPFGLDGREPEIEQLAGLTFVLEVRLLGEPFVARLEVFELEVEEVVEIRGILTGPRRPFLWCLG